MVPRFVLLAFYTTLDVCIDPRSQVWPPKDSFYRFYSAISSWVALCWGVMVSLKDGLLQRFTWGYYDAVLCDPKVSLFHGILTFLPLLHEGGVSLLLASDALF